MVPGHQVNIHIRKLIHKENCVYFEISKIIASLEKLVRVSVNSILFLLCRENKTGSIVNDAFVFFFEKTSKCVDFDDARYVRTKLSAHASTEINQCGTVHVHGSN